MDWDPLNEEIRLIRERLKSDDPLPYTQLRDDSKKLLDYIDKQHSIISDVLNDIARMIGEIRA